MPKKNWKKTILKEKSTIRDAIKSLNSSSLKIVIITDNKNKLLGIITDGNIRRAMLKQINLNSNVKSILVKKPVTVSYEVKYSDVVLIMKKNKIMQVPVVDENNIVIGLHTIDEVSEYNEKNNLFVIMAGGRGIRLKPITDSVPKPMIKINNKPMLEIIVDKARSEGFKNFVITTYYKSKLIRDYFGNGKKFNVNITYINEKKPLGTGGALAYLKNTTEDPIVLTNCDLISDINFSDMLKFHKKNDFHATMAVRNEIITSQFGVVKIKGNKLLSIIEKPTMNQFINTGIYVLNHDFLKNIKKNIRIQMTDLINKKVKKNNIGVYPIHEEWTDIGQMNDLNRIRKNKKKYAK